MKKRGLSIPPRLAVGDGALGFWAALEEIYPHTRHQRCWVHKIANVLNYLPKAVQPKAKQSLAQIWRPRPEPMRSSRSISSCRATGRNIRRRSSA